MRFDEINHSNELLRSLHTSKMEGTDNNDRFSSTSSRTGSEVVVDFAQATLSVACVRMFSTII